MKLRAIGDAAEHQSAPAHVSTSDELRGKAQAAVQTSLASYRVGRLSFMQLIDNQMTVNQYETETYRLIADYHQAVGDLEALVGGPLEQQ